MFKLLVGVILISSTLIFTQEKNNNFQIGIYALQSPPGTKGHQNGTLTEVKDDIRSVKGIINAIIPYRHWDRVRYESWNYTGFFLNYIKDLFRLTYSQFTNTTIQSLTPSLYSSFIVPASKNAPDDDSGIDRNLDVLLFSQFLETVLREEINLVFNQVNGDTAKFLSIILNHRLRPLGGWYLDDEPFIRNHDIEVIESMSRIIRLVETKVFYQNKILRDSGFYSLRKYRQLRYVAFDADDLHGYKISGRKSDAKFYNYNGKSIPLTEKKIYTIFKENTLDVIMPDFYHDDTDFWKTILRDIKSEFLLNNKRLPLIMPILKGFKSSYDKKNIDYQKLIEQLEKEDIAGIWLYSWLDSFDKTIDIKQRWNNKSNNLKKSILNLRKNR